MRKICPASLLSKIEQASQTKLARRGEWSFHIWTKLTFLKSLQKLFEKYFSQLNLMKNYEKRANHTDLFVLWVPIQYTCNADVVLAIFTSFWLLFLNFRYNSELTKTKFENRKILMKLFHSKWRLLFHDRENRNFDLKNLKVECFIYHVFYFDYDRTLK